MIRGLVLTIALLCSIVAQAGPFIVTEAHCNAITLNAVRATYAKMDGVPYPEFLRQVVIQATSTVYPTDTIMMDALPYSLEVAYEYYFNEIDDDDAYVDSISDKCIGNIGATAL